MHQEYDQETMRENHYSLELASLPGRRDLVSPVSYLTLSHGTCLWVQGGGVGGQEGNTYYYSDVHNHLIDCNGGHNYCINLANATCNHLTVATVVMN